MPCVQVWLKGKGSFSTYLGLVQTMMKKYTSWSRICDRDQVIWGNGGYEGQDGKSFQKCRRKSGFLRGFEVVEGTWPPKNYPSKKCCHVFIHAWSLSYNVNHTWWKTQFVANHLAPFPYNSWPIHFFLRRNIWPLLDPTSPHKQHWLQLYGAI